MVAGRDGELARSNGDSNARRSGGDENWKTALSTRSAPLGHIR